MAIRKNIPNTITSLNLLSGALACIFATKGDAQMGSLAAYQWAYLMIALAAVFDFCDGMAARMLKAYSELGKQLDSLSDLVSFGLAPSLVMFFTMEHFGAGIWSYFCLVIPLMGALRLAKFNIDDTQTTSFSGLPIPANALFLIGLSAWCYQIAYPNELCVLLAVYLCACAMVFPMRLMSLKFKKFTPRPNILRYLVVLCAILPVCIMGIPGLTISIALYVLISVCFPTKYWDNN